MRFVKREKIKKSLHCTVSQKERIETNSEAFQPCSDLHQPSFSPQALRCVGEDHRAANEIHRYKKHLNNCRGFGVRSRRPGCTVLDPISWTHIQVICLSMRFIFFLHKN